MAKIYSNNNIIFLIILLILGIVCALIFINDDINDDINYKNEIKSLNCTNNLTYAFFNVTNKEITYKKSNISVCNVN